METLYRKVAVSDDKKIIGRASNVIGHLNDLIHKLAYGGNDDLQEIAFKNAKDFFDILSKDFQSEIPDPTAQLQADKEEMLSMLVDCQERLESMNKRLMEVDKFSHLSVYFASKLNYIIQKMK